MNRTYANLQNIVYQMIDFNLERQKQSYESKTMLSPEYFAQFYQTVAYDPGRQCGKSMLIARSVEENDIVIVRNKDIKETIVNRIAVFNVIDIPVFTKQSLPPPHRGTNFKYNRIWIDDASTMSPEVISQVYKNYNSDQFILLG